MHAGDRIVRMPFLDDWHSCAVLLTQLDAGYHPIIVIGGDGSHAVAGMRELSEVLS